MSQNVDDWLCASGGSRFEASQSDHDPREFVDPEGHHHRPDRSQEQLDDNEDDPEFADDLENGEDHPAWIPPWTDEWTPLQRIYWLLSRLDSQITSYVPGSLARLWFPLENKDEPGTYYLVSWPSATLKMKSNTFAKVIVLCSLVCEALRSDRFLGMSTIPDEYPDLWTTDELPHVVDAVRRLTGARHLADLNIVIFLFLTYALTRN
ncbi:hypothetical protein B0H13DRAFT_2300656 [Mycena leptocephala]|nr:hypothetical protein B0H13DRAFT_2300656 [Mycena leptocephala]